LPPPVKLISENHYFNNVFMIKQRDNSVKYTFIPLLFMQVTQLVTLYQMCSNVPLNLIV